jgi:hypothetical protein
MVEKVSEAAWRHTEDVVWPMLLLVEGDYIASTRDYARESGLAQAVVVRDTAHIFDWLVTMAQYQGVSDHAADRYLIGNGIATWDDLAEALASGPGCSRLRCYCSFDGCGYHKKAGTCRSPRHLPACPLPRHPYRNGRLSQSAYSPLLFMRDVCDGDFVGWIDDRLEWADHESSGDARAMADAVMMPMTNIFGIARKVVTRTLAELLLGADPGRERWVRAGAAMIAVDALVHDFLHRTGVLYRHGAEHPHGDRCYRPGACADIIHGVSVRLALHPVLPELPHAFPRLVQYAIWLFCAQTRFDVCNGHRIDDRESCTNSRCIIWPECDHRPLRA